MGNYLGSLQFEEMLDLVLKSYVEFVEMDGVDIFENAVPLLKKNHIIKI